MHSCTCSQDISRRIWLSLVSVSTLTSGGGGARCVTSPWQEQPTDYKLEIVLSFIWKRPSIVLGHYSSIIRQLVLILDDSNSCISSYRMISPRSCWWHVSWLYLRSLADLLDIYMSLFLLHVFLSVVLILILDDSNSCISSLSDFKVMIYVSLLHLRP